MSDQLEQRKRHRDRSPNYPSIPLEQAIDRAQQLYDVEGQSPTPVNVILQHWGYSPKSGPGRTTLAALKHFGLLADEGSSENRRGRLTPLALAIIRDKRPDSPERDQALNSAALNPAIHRDLWEAFRGELPSDANLQYHLVSGMGFSDNGARDLVKELRATFDYARLRPYDALPSGDQTLLGNEANMNQGAKPAGQGAGSGTLTQRTLNLPLSPNNSATLLVPPTMSEREWTQMLAILQAMKPGIVSEDDPQGD